MFVISQVLLILITFQQLQHTLLIPECLILNYLTCSSIYPRT